MAIELANAILDLSPDIDMQPELDSIIELLKEKQDQIRKNIKIEPKQVQDIPLFDPKVAVALNTAFAPEDKGVLSKFHNTVLIHLFDQLYLRREELKCPDPVLPKPYINSRDRPHRTLDSLPHRFFNSFDKIFEEEYDKLASLLRNKKNNPSVLYKKFLTYGCLFPSREMAKLVLSKMLIRPFEFSLFEFPETIKKRVFGNLDPKSRINVSLTCKDWREAITPRLFKAIQLDPSKHPGVATAYDQLHSVKDFIQKASIKDLQNYHPEDLLKGSLYLCQLTRLTQLSLDGDFSGPCSPNSVPDPNKALDTFCRWTKNLQILDLENLYLTETQFNVFIPLLNQITGLVKLKLPKERMDFQGMSLPPTIQSLSISLNSKGIQWLNDASKKLNNGPKCFKELFINLVLPNPCNEPLTNLKLLLEKCINLETLSIRNLVSGLQLSKVVKTHKLVNLEFHFDSTHEKLESALIDLIASISSKHRDVFSGKVSPIQNLSLVARPEFNQDIKESVNELCYWRPNRKVHLILPHLNVHLVKEYLSSGINEFLLRLDTPKDHEPYGYAFDCRFSLDTYSSLTHLHIHAPIELSSMFSEVLFQASNLSQVHFRFSIRRVLSLDQPGISESEKASMAMQGFFFKGLAGILEAHQNNLLLNLNQFVLVIDQATLDSPNLRDSSVPLDLVPFQLPFDIWMFRLLSLMPSLQTAACHLNFIPQYPIPHYQHILQSKYEDRFPEIHFLTPYELHQTVNEDFWYPHLFSHSFLV